MNTGPSAHRNAARASTVHASHDMQPAGTMGDGKRRYRCTACRITATMPEASRACGHVDKREPHETPSRHPRKAPPPGAVPNRICAWSPCAAAYYSAAPRSKYCSHKCSNAAWNAQHVASGISARETKARRAAKRAAYEEMRADPVALAAYRDADAQRARARREREAAT